MKSTVQKNRKAFHPLKFLLLGIIAVSSLISFTEANAGRNSANSVQFASEAAPDEGATCNPACTKGQTCKNGQCVNKPIVICTDTKDPLCGIDSSKFHVVFFDLAGEISEDEAASCNPACSKGQTCKDGKCVNKKITICTDTKDPLCGIDD